MVWVFFFLFFNLTLKIMASDENDIKVDAYQGSATFHIQLFMIMLSRHQDSFW